MVKVSLAFLGDQEVQTPHLLPQHRKPRARGAPRSVPALSVGWRGAGGIAKESQKIVPLESPRLEGTQERGAFLTSICIFRIHFQRRVSGFYGKEETSEQVVLMEKDREGTPGFTSHSIPLRRSPLPPPTSRQPTWSRRGRQDFSLETNVLPLHLCAAVRQLESDGWAWAAWSLCWSCGI